MIYPGSLAASLILAYLLLFSRQWAWGLSALAALVSLFDWRENALVAAMLKVEVDALTVAMVSAASLMTVLKSLAVTLALLCLIWGLSAWALKRWRRS